MSTADQTPMLGQLLALSVEERCDWLLEWASPEFKEAVESLQQEFLAGRTVFPQGMTKRLAWAVAYNLDNIQQTYNFSPDVSWISIWQKLMLRELAISVMCEKNPEWQPAASLPIDEEMANAAFAVLYKELHPKILNSVSGKRLRCDELPEEVTQEVIIRFMKTHWSPESKTRFYGFSTISTKAYPIIRNVVADFTKERIRHLEGQAEEGSDATDSFGMNTSLSGGIHLDGLSSKEREVEGEEAHDYLGGNQTQGFKKSISQEQITQIEMGRNAPIEKIQQEQTVMMVLRAIETLPPKRKEVAKLYWLEGLENHKIAQKKEISPSAVTVHIQKACIHIRKYLEEHGVPPPNLSSKKKQLGS